MNQSKTLQRRRSQDVVLITPSVCGEARVASNAHFTGVINTKGVSVIFLFVYWKGFSYDLRNEQAE
jgi:hypothetical protein